MNRYERRPIAAGEAEVEYLDGEFRILRPGAFVRCAATGVAIRIEDLRYWNVDLQEPYASPGGQIAAAQSQRPRPDRSDRLRRAARSILCLIPDAGLGVGSMKACASQGAIACMMRVEAPERRSTASAAARPISRSSAESRSNKETSLANVSASWTSAQPPEASSAA